MSVSLKSANFGEQEIEEEMFSEVAKKLKNLFGNLLLREFCLQLGALLFSLLGGMVYIKRISLQLITMWLIPRNMPLKTM